MKELDLLKKDWQRQDQGYPKVNKESLYAMLKKKSSSIVKLLFYISIGELVFWLLINYFPLIFSERYKEKLIELYKDDIILIAFSIFGYFVIFAFIYFLYKSYRKIDVADSAKKLMENILKTRKIVKFYVIYNLAVIVFSIVFGIVDAIQNKPDLHSKFMDLSDAQKLKVYIVVTLLTFAMVGVFWLFYRLIYGILLKRLNKNYRELKRMEV